MVVGVPDDLVTILQARTDRMRGKGAPGGRGGGGARDGKER